MKIVILSYESLYSSMVIAHLLEARPGQVVGIVLSSCIVHGKGLLGSVWHVLRRAGPEFFFRKSVETIQYKAGMWWCRLTGRSRRVQTVSELAAKHAIPLIHARDVNAPSIQHWIEERQPDLMISVYLNQRIGEELLALPPRGTLNVHPALLPRHRGLFPYFWVLAHGENETGVTVHFVDATFDTGAIVAQQTLEVTPNDTIQSLSYRSALIGGPLLVKSVDDIATGTVSPVPQNGSQASYHSWPTSEAYRRFRRAGRRFGSFGELLRYL